MIKPSRIHAALVGADGADVPLGLRRNAKSPCSPAGRMSAARSPSGLRPSAVHGRDLDRLSRDARGGGEPRADDAGAGRQVAGDHRRQSADMELAAKRVMMGKTLNAGQICLAPDYVMVPKDKASEFVGAAEGAVRTMFPTLKDNPGLHLRHQPAPLRPPDGLHRRREGEGRGDRRAQSGERGFPPAAVPQDSADAGPQSDRRHEDHEGRDLRAAAAGEDLRRASTRRSATSTSMRVRSASIISARMRRSRRRC